MGPETNRDTIHEVAKGRVWTGEQALEHKLIDRLGGVHDAIAEAERRANISNASIVFYPEYKSFWEELLAEVTNPPADSSMSFVLDKFNQVLLDDLFILNKILTDYGIAAMIPYRIDLK